MTNSFDTHHTTGIFVYVNSYIAHGFVTKMAICQGNSDLYIQYFSFFGYINHIRSLISLKSYTSN